MKYSIDGQCVDLGDHNLLGEGGEAKVYDLGTYAAKIYHQDGTRPGSTVLPGRMTTAAEKLVKVQAFPAGVPSQVVAPQKLVRMLDGTPTGFTMIKLPKAEDARILSSRKREGGYSNAQGTQLFWSMHRVVDSLHKVGVVIGDFNSSNVMFQNGPT